MNDSRLDLDCQNYQLGDSYLIAAARGGMVSLVETLLKFRGVRLNATNKRNESALGVARQLNHHHFVKLLVNAGASN